MDDVSHKRRREDEETGPSKRIRENGQELSRSSPPTNSKDGPRRDDRDERRDPPREAGREPVRRPSPNGRDRYGAEPDRDLGRRTRGETSGRDDARGSSARERDRDSRREGPGTDRDRDSERERDRSGRDSERRIDERSRRDNVRDADEKDREKDRLEGPRRDRKDHDAVVDRQSDRKDAIEETKVPPHNTDPVPTASSSAGPPSGPRAMANPAPRAPASLSKGDSSFSRGGMRSDQMNGSGTRSRDLRAPGGPLLSRIAAGPSSREVRNGSEPESSAAVPTKRTPVESPTDSVSRNKRVRLNRNFEGRVV